MKKLSILGLSAATALLCAVPVSLQMSQNTLSISLDKAAARVGNPLSAGSVAGVHRRAARRTARSAYTGGYGYGTGYGASQGICPHLKASQCVGNTNRNIEPRWLPGETQIRPPWASIIDLQTDSPIPMPVGLVVNMAWKTR